MYVSHIQSTDVNHELYFTGTISKSEVDSSVTAAEPNVSSKDDDTSEEEDEDEEEDEHESSSSEEDSEENEDSDLTPAEIARQKVIKRITVSNCLCLCVCVSVCVVCLPVTLCTVVHFNLCIHAFVEAQDGKRCCS